jgi:hypothetical protein
MGLSQMRRAKLQMERSLWRRLLHARSGLLSAPRVTILLRRGLAPYEAHAAAPRKKLWVWWGTCRAPETAAIIKLLISADTPLKDGRTCLEEMV